MTEKETEREREREHRHTHIHTQAGTNADDKKLEDGNLVQ